MDGFRDQHWCATSTDADWVDAGKWVTLILHNINDIKYFIFSLFQDLASVILIPAISAHKKDITVNVKCRHYCKVKFQKEKNQITNKQALRNSCELLRQRKELHTSS